MKFSVRKGSLFWVAALILCASVGLHGQGLIRSSEFSSQSHPRVFATDEDRATLQKKIQNIGWAGNIYKVLKADIDSLVERHKADPEYIVSRLQMNWEDGRHYTDFYTSQGLFIPRREGNAPYPTVRLTYGRSANGSTPAPPYDKLRPYGNGDLQRLVDGKWVTVPFEKTGMGAEVTNQKIIEDAYKASIVYYFTGDKSYAKFAADIIWTFVRGASYHNPVNKEELPSSAGFLSFETLGDTRRFATLPLAYDFVYDYLKSEYFDSKEFNKGRKGELWAPGHPQGKKWAWERIHLMFGKMIENKLTRGGGLRGNWNTNEHESAMLYALALDNNDQYPNGKGREYYTSRLLYGPTTSSHGAYADLTKANINHDTGLWHEPPGGYGQNSISQLIRLGYWYYKNGIDILQTDTLLRKAALSFPQVAFPNGYVTNWGDSNYLRLNAEQAELMLAYANSKNDKAMADMYSALLLFSGERPLTGVYYSPLFFYAPELNEVKPDISYPRVSYSPDHSLIFERNLASDFKDALQYNVYGYGKNSAHRQANGMAMELYGRGQVLGIDPGWGPDYWVEQHRLYNAKAASHNTVMPNGQSGEVKMAQDLKIVHAEPIVSAGKAPGREISASFQFTDTYNDFVTSTVKADQRRLMGIIRTGKKAGYYVDVFRSKMRGTEDKYHDYLYHNIGSGLTLFDKAGSPLPLTATELDSASGEGYKFFEDDAAISYPGDFYGIFDYKVNGVQMKVLMPGNEGRTIYSVTAPNAFRHYQAELRQLRLPTLVVRQKGEAWSSPFIAIYEPFGDGIESSVKAVRSFVGAPATGAFTGLVVERNTGVDYILNSVDSTKVVEYEGVDFQGIYGVVHTETGNLKELYLGAGTKLSRGNYGIEAVSPVTLISASLLPESDRIHSFSSDKEARIQIPYQSSKANFKNLRVSCQTESGTVTITDVEITSSKNERGIAVISAVVPAAVRGKIIVTEAK